MDKQIESYIDEKNDKKIVSNNNNTHTEKILLRNNTMKKNKISQTYSDLKTVTSSLDQTIISPILLSKYSKQDLPIKVLSSDKVNTISTSTVSAKSRQFPFNKRNKRLTISVLEERKSLKSLILNRTKNYLRSNSTSTSHKILSSPSTYSTNNNSNIFMTSKNINFNTLNNKSINKKYIFKKQNDINYDTIPEIDPLSIPEEDKIFSEINQNKNTKKKNNGSKTYSYFSKGISKQLSLTDRSEKNKKMIKTFYGRKKFYSKEILNNLYMTTGDYYDELNKIKKSKNEIDLECYQDHLLAFIQPLISTHGFKQLKKQLSSIKKSADVSIKNYREQIKTIEDDEEKIINNINFFYDSYMKNKNRLTNFYHKHSLKYFDLQLPSIKFIRVVKGNILKKDIEIKKKDKGKVIK